MTKNILASVIIPVFNSERTIKETLNSLKKQTEKRFEVIVVDDGSTDKSYSIISNFKKSLNLKILKQKNSGPASARNKGAKISKAEVLIFLDSDCVPKKDFIQEILKPLGDGRVSGVQGEYETKNKKSLMARYIGYEILFRHNSKSYSQRIDHIATYACAYRKKDFGKGFREDFKNANMEDTELSYRLAKREKILVFNNKAIVLHPHPNSLLRFIIQQYRRGFWRILGHANHQDKLIRDSYMGSSILVQGALSLLFFLNLFLALIGSFFLIRVFIFPFVLLLLIIFSNATLGFYCYKYEKKMILIAPIIATLRSLAGTLGFIVGFFYFNLKRSINKFK